MSAARKKTDEGSLGAGLARFVPPLRVISPSLILGLLVVVGFGAGVYALWRWIGHSIVSDSSYLVVAERIEITPQPEWIGSDVRADVAEYALAQPRDVRDRELTVQMAQAFAMNPWVASVVRVSKRYPAGVTVVLEYRRPAAIVEVISSEGKRSVLLVDGEGVLLPTKECPKEKVLSLPRINVGDTWPSGGVGSRWGDKRVHAGAMIAAALSKHWDALGLYRIQLTEDAAAEPALDEPVYELTTRGGARIVWGHRPSGEVGREPESDVKIRRLLAYVKKNGPLDPPDGTGPDAPTPPIVVDLQNPGGLKARTAPTASRAFLPL
jgi:hypothetical protein